MQYRPSSAYSSQFFTTNSGAPVWNNNSSLTVGSRGILCLWQLINLFVLSFKNLLQIVTYFSSTLMCDTSGLYFCGLGVRTHLYSAEMDVFPSRHSCEIEGMKNAFCQIHSRKQSKFFFYFFFPLRVWLEKYHFFHKHLDWNPNAPQLDSLFFFFCPLIHWLVLNMLDFIFLLLFKRLSYFTQRSWSFPCKGIWVFKLIYLIIFHCTLTVTVHQAIICVHIVV